MWVAAEGAAVRDVMVRTLAVEARGAEPAMAGAMMMGSGGDGPSAGIGEDGRPLAFATMFYPNATVSNRATVIGVTSGEERSAVDFHLRAVPTSKVSGIATGPDGPVSNLQVMLVPQEVEQNATQMETITGFSDGQGRFTIEGVPPGSYVLRATRIPRVALAGNVMTYSVSGGGAMVVEARSITPAAAPPPQPTAPTLWAEMTVAVGNKDLENLALTLRTGMKMSGIVQFNGSAEKPAPQMLNNLGIILEPADPKPGVPNANGRVDQTGSFSTVGVPPGRYFVRLRGAIPGWTFQSAMAGGRDASVVPVEIESNDLNGVMLTFTDRPSELSGQVSGDGPLEGTTVIVFPADSSAWTGYGSTSRRLVMTRADKQGNFKVDALPAGDYVAVAMPDKMANDWQNPKFLEAMTGVGSRVHISDNSKANVGLKVIK
jgi:hypothetical protein